MNMGTQALPASDPVRLRFGAFELDEANARLLRNGQATPLAPKPFALLCELVRRQGALCSKQALLDKVWGHQFVSDSVLKTAISDLRTVLGDDPRNPRFIETASRRGYRFVAPVTTMPAASPEGANAAGVASPRSSGFVGRSAELTRLHRAWDLACSGKRSVVWVVGEPGIGKTALIEQFVGSLGELPVRAASASSTSAPASRTSRYSKPSRSSAGSTAASPNCFAPWHRRG